MKKLLFLLIPFLMLSNTIDAQNSAVSYYRKMLNETKKISKKRMKYMQVSLQNESPAKVDKYRAMVVDQLETSIKAIKKMKAFKGDTAYRNDYVRILSMYQKAYTESFEEIQNLGDSAKTSYESMIILLNAEEAMDDEIAEAKEKLERADLYFSNKYNFDVIVDEEREEQYELLDAVIIYTRDIKRSYYRVEALLIKFPTNFATGDIEIKQERYRQRETVKAIEITRSDLIKIGDFEGDDNHVKDVLSILEDLESACNKDLSDILDLLDDGSYDERAWDKGIKKYEAFVSDLHKYTDEYYESKAEFIYRYSPDDFKE